MKMCPTCGQSLPVDKLEEAGRAAAAEAERLWHLDVFDPPIGSKAPRAAFCLAEIEDIIEVNGWGWALPYRGDGPPQWCGMFAGACWIPAGLDDSWLPTYFASTHRLSCWGTYQRFDSKGKQNPKPGAGVERRLYIDLTKPLPPDVTPRRGDIVIVGDGDPTVGDHVTICVGFDGAGFDTISGNGGGAGPNGDTRQGISRRTYFIGQKGYKPLWLVRPATGDLR